MTIVQPQQSTGSLKPRYRNSWGPAKEREDAVIHVLQQLGIPIKRVGHGSGSASWEEGYHTGVEDRYDLHDPRHNVYFEVTGTSWTKAESEKRLGIATLAILCEKVQDAKRYGVLSRLYFAQVCEAEGEILFIPASKCEFFRSGFYSNGESQYFLIPWSEYVAPRVVADTLNGIIRPKELMQK
jgi:hypothetical protein